jgi:hypothetical protein
LGCAKMLTLRVDSKVEPSYKPQSLLKTIPRARASPWHRRVKLPFRFSILHLLLVTAISGLAIALYLSQARLTEAEQETERLHRLFGELTITDPSQVHVVAVPTAEGTTWRWRIYLPAGHDFGLFSHLGNLDADGLPLKNSRHGIRIGGQSSPREAREIVIDVALGKAIEGDHSCLWVSENGKGGTPQVIFWDAPTPSWLSGKFSFHERAAGAQRTLACDPATPLALIALDGDKAGIPSCDDAVVIWIGPYENKTVLPTQSLRERGVLPWRQSR